MRGGALDGESTSGEPVELGDKRCMIEGVQVTGEISECAMVMTGEYFDISIKIRSVEPIGSLNVGIGIKDERGMLIFGTNTMLLGNVYSLEKGEYMAHFRMLNRMPRGSYQVDVALIPGESHYDGCYHWLENVASFTVHDSAVTHFLGNILLDADVTITSIGESVFSRMPYIAADNQVRSFGRANNALKEYKSAIAPLARVQNLFAGMDVCIPLRVENTGEETWEVHGRKPVMLAYRWLSSDGEIIVGDGPRTRLPADVLPGGAVIVPMKVTIPTAPKSLQLVITLVQEFVAWFVDRNPSAAYVIPVELG